MQRTAPLLRCVALVSLARLALQLRMLPGVAADLMSG